MIYLALYKGPASDLMHIISHWVTCIVLSVRTLKFTKYSHTEVCIDGVCYSSSVRDKGVRSKVINLDSGKWDYIDITSFVDKEHALEVFNSKRGKKYDWFGALGFGLPFLKQNPDKEYCFEITAEMLGFANPAKVTPQELIDIYGKPVST